MTDIIIPTPQELDQKQAAVDASTVKNLTSSLVRKLNDHWGDGSKPITHTSYLVNATVLATIQKEFAAKGWAVKHERVTDTRDGDYSNFTITRAAKSYASY